MKDIQLKTLEQLCLQYGIEIPFESERIKAGRNSEVWKLFNRTGQWLLKNYCNRIGDNRDRLGTEFNFLSFLINLGIQNVPKPIGKDLQFNRGIYSFLKGDRLKNIEAWHITQASDFIKRINQHNSSHLAQSLPQAAEACFSIMDHLNSVQRRIERLTNLDSKLEIEFEAKFFVKAKINQAWIKIRQLIETDSKLTGKSELFCESERILSPSDFGFHNSLQNDDTLFFVDFEYAGWDDIAKLICDFTCQPELPVTKIQAQQFTEELITGRQNSESINYRINRLLPLHRIKWCCILLNEFIDEERQRRWHAGYNEEGLLEVQLLKASRYFDEHLSDFS